MVVCFPSCLRPKRVADLQTAQAEAVLHVFGVKHVATRLASNGDNHRIVKAELVRAGDGQPALLHGERQGMNGAYGCDQRQKFLDLIPIHLPFTPHDIGDFIEHLHADDALAAEQLRRLLRFVRIGGEEIEHDVAVKGGISGHWLLRGQK